MAKQKTERTVSLMLGPATFIELENRSYDENSSLAEIYIAAIEQYIGNYIPDRATVLAAPGAGKRIRVTLSRDLYNRLRLKIGTSGYNLNDVIYTSFEFYLNVFPKTVAA